MYRERLLRFLALLIVCIALFHLAAIFFGWYWKLWWIDIFLHVMGGAWLSLSFLWLLFFSNYVPRPVALRFRHFFLVIICVLLTAILWEVFEWSVGATFALQGYWFDTIKDIVDGVTGGLLGCLIFLRYFFPKHV